MSYQKLFISRPSEGTKLWPKFLAQKSFKKASPKKTKKPRENQKTKKKQKQKTIFQDSCKSKNPKNLEKTKKNKKINIPGLLQK